MQLDFYEDEVELNHEYEVINQIDQGLHGVVYLAQETSNPK